MQALRVPLAVVSVVVVVDVHGWLHADLRPVRDAAQALQAASH
jgi:hypothetical protein